MTTSRAVEATASRPRSASKSSPHLVAEADRQQVVIVVDTHVEKLARIYAQDMQGLRIVAQRRTINGETWTLQRDPHPVGS